MPLLPIPGQDWGEICQRFCLDVPPSFLGLTKQNASAALLFLLFLMLAHTTAQSRDCRGAAMV